MDWDIRFFLVHGQEACHVPVDNASRHHGSLQNSGAFILPETGHGAQFIREKEPSDIIGDIAVGE